jgi:hypothetical protein
MIYKLFRAMALLDSAVQCRTCGQGIERKDEFGLAEGVCEPCRD